MEKPMAPLVLSCGEGKPIWYFGSCMTLKANAEQTGGQYSFFEELLPACFQTHYHIHRNEDETFYVIEGSVEFIMDGQINQATPGSFVYLPKNIPHGLRVTGDQSARLLYMINPSGFEQFFSDFSESVGRIDLLKPTAPDIPKLIEMSNKYNVRILGPLDLFITETL
jgi:mannose-6-phosphate isomerase-like protein (cupin superfamily)